MKPVKQHRLIHVGYMRFLAIQLAVISTIALVLWWMTDGRHAYSALLGGLICIIPGYVFALNVFKYSGAQALKKIVQRLYWGEGLKLIMTFLLFALVFIFIPIEALPFFITFIAIQLSYWFAPLLLKK